MKTFTGWQYLLIDVANHYGHDKLTFEDRITWAETHLHELEALADQAEAKPLYLKTCITIREAQAGRPLGHLVAFDAVCSGIQIMSATTGCVEGATATGMIDPDVRADAYSEVTGTMNKSLSIAGLAHVSFPRKDVKQAVMTACYGSKKVPKKLFGEETPELEAFYQACYTVAPGAFMLLEELLDTWQPYAMHHTWVLPDNGVSHVKVMETIEKEGIEIDELDHATFTYKYKVNCGQKSGLSNVANVVHSIDAWLLRSLVRRCNYDVNHVDYVIECITAELLARSTGSSAQDITWVGTNRALENYIQRYQATQLADVVILPHLDQATVTALTTQHLRALNHVLCDMASRAPCPVITIHDSFATHPNHVDTVRHWYKELMAELAESTILDDIFSQLHGCPIVYPKRSHNLGDKIRLSNYALS